MFANRLDALEHGRVREVEENVKWMRRQVVEGSLAQLLEGGAEGLWVLGGVDGVRVGGKLVVARQHRQEDLGPGSKGQILSKLRQGKCEKQKLLFGGEEGQGRGC
eukprot:4572860-Pleurochrysis_carterae.AAC.1